MAAGKAFEISAILTPCRVERVSELLFSLLDPVKILWINRTPVLDKSVYLLFSVSALSPA